MVMIIGIILLVLYFLMSLQDVQFMVKVQAVMLFGNIGAAVVTGLLPFFSGHWSFSNIAPIFHTNLSSSLGIPG
ncbi:MAG TPA: hypothetical protein DEB05_02810 [Firmicutes bacterium]|nr:hypothetical protein [Bacillota bacterium]